MKAAVAELKFVRISPQKMRLVADLVRGKGLETAINTLKFSPQKAAKLILKTLMSAVANAEHNQGLDIDLLMVKEIRVDQGPVMKRMRPRAKGRGNRILKRTSHLHVTVGMMQG